uniref:Uncharacterized protein n=1 Tax=Quercus lobata TaxID=97700 RepID=A0A7N2KTA3_QUELO
MDVEAVVSIVIRKLTDLLIQESIIFNMAINEVELVRISLRKMQNFLINAEDEKELDKCVKECVDDILTVVYKVEDAIEAFVLQRMYARGMGFAWRAETLKKSNQVKPLRIPQLTSHRSSYQDEGLTMNQQNNNSSYPVDEETEVIGFREGIRKLVVMLTDRVYQGLRVISLKGDHGYGKTTLATAIYKSREVKVDKKSTKKELAEKIHKNLQEKRFLVVLDDLQELSVWKELLDTFPDPKNGSRVMLTTSNHHVAFSADTRVQLHQLNPLNDEDTWELFLKKGLPLAITVLGGLLSTKEVSYEVWLKVIEHPSWQLDSEQVQFSNILALKLRPCFLYFWLFPKDYDIPLRRLLRLWLAEGFVRQSPGMTPEDTVEIYLEELVKRSMIQISKRRKDGSPKTCRMLGALHNDSNFLSKAQEIGLFHIYQLPGNENPKHGVRRFADYVDTKECPMKIQNLRTYLSFNIQKNDMPVKEIDGFLSLVLGQKFGLLRVLDLERVYKPKLPNNMGKLFLLLRYLGLRWTFLDTLPYSVGELPYLETSDVKHTYISSLPSSIWKMKHLRHLCLNEIRLDMYSQKHGTSLTHLQTLWGMFVDNKTLVKNGLYRLINLRKLGLTCHLDSFQELDEWIARLASLQSLKIRSKNQNGQPWKLNLKPLSSLQNLTHLYLLGSLPEPHDRYEFPPKLTVLTLSISKLEKDPMPILAQLPSLSVLRLLADSYTGKELNCPPGGFSMLRILKLWMLKNLETWKVGE